MALDTLCYAKAADLGVQQLRGHPLNDRDTIVTIRIHKESALYTPGTQTVVAKSSADTTL